MQDRIVELYFWILGIYFEPQYSGGRILVTKVIFLISICDDTYDSYATFEELQCLTDAIQRWDRSCVDQLPDYMKIIFTSILNLFEEIENDLCLEGRAYSANYSKEALKETVMAYYIEAKWLNQGYVPRFDEYMKNALPSSCCTLIAVTSVVGMGETAGKHAFEWMKSRPKCIESCETIGRLLDDIVGHKVEQERKHIASAVECYMREYRVSEEDAVEKLRQKVEDGWKDLNEECLSPATVSMHILMRIFNLTCVTGVVYKFDDGYTNPATYVKDYITLLFVDPISIPQ